MQPERVWAIGRSGGKYSCKWTIGIGTGMNFQYLAIRLMKPGYDDDLVTRSKAVESFSRKRVNFKPRVRGAFASLHWGLFKAFQAGPDNPDRPQLRNRTDFSLPWRSFIRGHTMSPGFRVPTSRKTGEKWGTPRIFSASLFTDKPPVAMRDVVHSKDGGAGAANPLSV